MEDYRLRAQNNYRAKKAQLSILIEKEDRQAIQDRAKAEGMSIKDYILKMCLKGEK